MNLNFTFLITLFLCFVATQLCAQEKTDTTRFKDRNLNDRQLPTYIDPYLHYTIEKPELVKEPDERWKEQVFQGKSWKQFRLKEVVKKMPDGKEYQKYSSPNNALHYFGGSDPILYGFDFHLKPIMELEKIDIYFFGNGTLVYRYSGDKIMPANYAHKNFFWNVGGGVEYEYHKDRYVFYEYSTQFRNSSFRGGTNKAGARFRF